MTVNAQAETDAVYLWLARRTIHAGRWLEGLEKAIEGLSDFPTRWSLARESREFEEPVRQLLHGKSPHAYRVLFIVRASVVSVLHVRHGARLELVDEESMFPNDE